MPAERLEGSRNPAKLIAPDPSNQTGWAIDVRICPDAGIVQLSGLKDYKLHIFIIVLSSSTLSCAATADRTDPGDNRGSDCIYESSIRGYVLLDEANLIVDASARRKYHIGLRRRALGLRSSWGIAFDSPTGRVCARSYLLFDGQFGKESIPIAFIRELSPDEQEILLIEYGRKEPEIKQTPAPVELPGAEVEELDSGSRDRSSGT